MRKYAEIMFREEEVDQRTQGVTDQINRDYGDTPLHLTCIPKGGAMFICELAERLTMLVSSDFISVLSYDDTESSGVVRTVKDLDESLENKHVLIVEDVIDTGRTLVYLIEMLEKRGPKDIHLCTLFDKPERRVKKQATVNYIYSTIPDRLVVGYGLDYDQKHRNYPYIDAVEFEDDKA